MKRFLLLLIVAFATAAQGASLGAEPPNPQPLEPLQQEAQAAHLAAGVISRYHYKAVPLNDAFSARIFDQYVKALDSEKTFFLQSDIDRLAPDRTRFVEAVLREDLSVPFAIFNLYERRVAERFAYARALLREGFSFQKLESYQYAREKQPWPKTDSEMQELWRKRVKNDWLRLRLAGERDRNIVEILDKRYENTLKRIGQLKSEDAFQTYMNAYTLAIDPHTNYLGPRAAEDFGISMSLSLVGIGAALTQLDEYPTIRDLVPGGPASLSGQLKVGDRIVGVAQGEGAMIEVLGRRLDEVVALIRGAPDSVVRLDVLPVEAGTEGKHVLVSLVRKSINLEEQAAKVSVHSTMDGNTTRRVGVISLASFYEDFAAKQKGVRDYRSATRDVARLLDQLKKDNVDSVLIDLRNDGGGSLAEAVSLTGLFIDQGPVVQQRNASGQIVVERDTQPGVAWDGPLGVLINRSSASASEIFAAAIQDYGRGLIIGEPSFGKGTVQSVVNLDELARNGKPQFGELRMTVAQFFRVNGGTTQLRGVKPDIVFPPIFDEEHFGESSLDNALPWTQIKAAAYSPAGDLKALLPALVSLHETRVKKDKGFRALQQEIAEMKLQRRRNAVSLNEAERRKERDALISRQTRRIAGKGADDDRAGGSAPADDGLQPDERNLAVQLAAEKARKDAKDVFLEEAVNILGDEVRLLKTDARLAARVRSSVSLPD